MLTYKDKKKLIRKEKKLLKKLGSFPVYKMILSTINTLLKPVKIFSIISGTGIKTILGVISLSTYRVFGRKVGYIDDFIVHKKARGKGVGKKLLSKIISKGREEKHDYLTLVSHKDRKTSHAVYKKIGFTVVSLGLFVFAVKKVRKK